MLVPLQLPPGLERNNTPYDTVNAWWDQSLVRWQSGSMTQVGGWRKLTAAPLDSAIRKIHVYRDNSNQRQTLVGSDAKLYYDNGSSYVDVTMSGFTPLTAIGTGGGYGAGTYGSSTYGTARPSPSPVFSPFAYWSMDNWGQDVILTANSDGRLFYYSTAAATTAPTVITTAPTGNNAVVVTAERHVMAIGQNGSSGSLFRVAWSSREDYTDWDFASVTNTAGFQDLDSHSPLLYAHEVREGHLIFSYSDVYLAQYVGLPFIYGFTRLTDTALLHPYSVAPFNGKAVWFSRNGFQLYNSGVVSPLPCPIFNDIRTEMDAINGPFRIFSGLNGRFPEIWWFYPTDGNSEANRYVMWNYAENWWGWGMLSRSAIAPAVVYSEPFMGTSGGDMYEHEEPGVFTDNGQPRYSQVFIESGDIPLTQDNSIIDINQMQVATGVGFQSLQITAYSQYTPEGTETTYGPYTPRADGYTDTRISARNVRLRFQPVADVDWGVGLIKADIPKQSGAKR